MSNIALKQMTALGHHASTIVEIGPLTIKERFDVASASLTIRHNEEANVEMIAQSIGINLSAPSRFTFSSIYSNFWIAPSSWMIEASFETHEDLAKRLKQEFGRAASITEQTDGWVRFDILGQRQICFFERLTAFDLASADIGSACRCTIEHVGCFIVVRDFQVISIIGPRSSAAFLLHALETTAKAVF